MERALGERAGSSSVTVTAQQMPQHLHTLNATSTLATSNAPTTTAALAGSTSSQLYGGAANLQAMSPAAISNVGGSQPHNNMMPYLVLNFCIALQGIFPSPN